MRKKRSPKSAETYYLYLNTIRKGVFMRLYKLFLRCISIRYPSVDSGASYAVMREGDSLYIFFEGSNGENDWRANLDFPAKAYKRMGRTVWFAHRGFLDTWKNTEAALSQYILDTGIKGIAVTGYSHGAAIAALCHEYIWYNRPDLRDSLEGYGFGSPRVLWGVMSDEVKKRWEKFTVIRNIDDAVTHLPPAFLGYFHIGKMLQIGEKGKYTKIDAHRPENIAKELLLYESEKQPMTPKKP